jgi:hypothetical protein
MMQFDEMWVQGAGCRVQGTGKILNPEPRTPNPFEVSL